MKAAQIDTYGDVSVIEVREIEKPAISGEQVLVRVNAASLNPFDSAVRAGYAQAMAPFPFPGTLGLDLAGTIAEVGSDVTGFAVGDRVFGTANAMFGASGAFAEFAATNACNIAHTPENVSDADATALPTAGISALQALTDELGIQSGQKLFINGGAGGIGTIAIQIAKHLGAYVATTASSDNVEFVKSLGADEVIDYKSQSFTDTIHGYDAALDTVGGDSLNDVLHVLKKGGKAVTLAGQFDQEKATALGVTGSSQMTHVQTKVLTDLATLVADGVVKVTVEKTYPLDQIKQAFTARETESIKGKIVISIT